VVELGKEISREYEGGGWMWSLPWTGLRFRGGLVRQINAPMVCHFVREDVKDVEQSGHVRREVFLVCPRN